MYATLESKIVIFFFFFQIQDSDLDAENSVLVLDSVA